MFTGIIEELGRVAAREDRPDGRRFWIEAPLVSEGLAIGDSVAHGGCCLTVVAREGARYAVEAVPETLRLTTLGDWREGDAVNLERSVAMGARLGGHLVQGHVDGVGEVVAVTPEGDGRRVALRVPEPLRRFVAHKGSLAVDGVSLTVAALTADGCEIAYIPHTLAVTTAGTYVPGRRVHLEVDLLARYLARLLEETGMPGRNS
ncbi:MAG: riboflavin synthase [Candidatus Eisenbacteria bacterium]